MEYRKSDYFNAEDWYLFRDEPMKKEFESQVHFDKEKGAWFTNSGLQYKATSLKCVKLTLTPAKTFGIK